MSDKRPEAAGYARSRSTAARPGPHFYSNEAKVAGGSDTLIHPEALNSPARVSEPFDQLSNDVENVDADSHEKDERRNEMADEALIDAKVAAAKARTDAKFAEVIGRIETRFTEHSGKMDLQAFETRA